MRPSTTKTDSVLAGKVLRLTRMSLSIARMRDEARVKFVYSEDAAADERDRRK